MSNDGNTPVAEHDPVVELVLNAGELGIRENQTFSKILVIAARALDKSCADDIAGSTLFKADDGRYYTTPIYISIELVPFETLVNELKEIVANNCDCDQESGHAHTCSATPYLLEYDRVVTAGPRGQEEPTDA